MLTNGRLFAYLPYAENVAAVGLNSLILCVPLYSDVDAEHDFVVQAQGAFDQTVRGLLNLARAGVPVEIRVVVHRLTYRRLPQLAEFVARNMPFVTHVALMGLEMTGFTKANLDALWIDPAEYQDELGEAVEILDASRIRVSIYNHQLCLLPESLLALQPAVDLRLEEHLLAGMQRGAPFASGAAVFFASATLRHSAHIRKFTESP